MYESGADSHDDDKRREMHEIEKYFHDLDTDCAPIGRVVSTRSIVFLVQVVLIRKKKRRRRAWRR
jgi:hypothetical protein